MGRRAPRPPDTERRRHMDERGAKGAEAPGHSPVVGARDAELGIRPERETRAPMDAQVAPGFG